MNVNTEIQAIYETLQELQQAHLAQKRLLRTLWAIFGLACTLCLALGLAAFSWTYATQICLGLGAIITLGGLLIARARHKRPATRTWPYIAQLGEQLLPELGTALSSAVFFAESSVAPAGYSWQLTQAHQRYCATQLTRFDLPARFWATQRACLQRSLVCSLFAVVVAIGCLWYFSHARERLWAAVHAGEITTPSAEPLLYDLQVTYQLPAYTKTTPQQHSNIDGSIAVLTGSEVTLKGVSREPLRQAFVQLEMPGHAPQLLPMHLIDAEHPQISLTLTTSAEYRFVVVTQTGSRYVEQAAHLWQILPDEMPSVDFDFAQDNKAYHPQDFVPLAWHAQDDFGITQVTLLIGANNNPQPDNAQTIELYHGNNNEQNFVQKTYRWQLAALPRLEEGNWWYQLAVTDNDTISGPKKSVSVKRQLMLQDEYSQHKEWITQLQDLQKTLLDVLAIDLSEPLVLTATTLNMWQKNSVESLKILQNFLKIATQNATKNDAPTKQIQQVYNNLNEHITTAMALRQTPKSIRASTLAEWVQKRQQAILQWEIDTLYIDDLLKMQQLDVLQQNKQDLHEAQKTLQNTLTNHQSQVPPEERFLQLQKQLQTLKATAQKLMQNMHSLNSPMPGAYQNQEQQTPSRLADSFAELENHLRHNDLAAAEKSLQELSQQLDALTKNIDEAKNQYGEDRYQAERAKIAELRQDWQKLTQAQQHLNQEIEHTLQTTQEQLWKTLGLSENAWSKKLHQRLEQTSQQLQEAVQANSSAKNRSGNQSSIQSALQTATKTLENTMMFAKQHDFANAKQQVAQLQQQLSQLADRKSSGQKALGKAAHSAQEAQSMLEQLFNTSQQLQQNNHQKAQELKNQQQQVQSIAQQVQEQFASLAKEIPFFSDPSQTGLKTAQSHMQKSQEALQQADINQGKTHAAQALAELNKLAEQLTPQDQPGQAGSFPMPRIAESGVGIADNNQSVDIPKQQAEQAHERFRKALLKAAQEPPPPRFERAVPNYYKELLR